MIQVASGMWKDVKARMTIDFMLGAVPSLAVRIDYVKYFWEDDGSYSATSRFSINQPGFIVSFSLACLPALPCLPTEANPRVTCTILAYAGKGRGVRRSLH